MERYPDPVSVEVNGQKFSLDPVEMLKINYLELKDHLMRWPGNYAWVGAIKETITKQVSKLEFDLEVTYARLDSTYRSRLEGKGRDHDREVKSKVLMSPEYAALKDRLLEMQCLEGKVKSILNALGKMDSVLIQLFTMYKKEESTQK